MTTTSNKNNKGNNGKKNKPDFLSRYSSMAVKMVVIILAGTFGGQWLDERFSLSTPVFTLVLSLASVALSIYVMIRDISSK